MDASAGNAATADGGQAARRSADPSASEPATVAVAPPLRVTAADRATAPVARAVPAPLPDADPKTLPIPLIALRVPPARPALVAPAAPATPPRRTWSGHARGYVRHLSPLQVLCWQVAALAVLLTVRQPWPVLVGASVGAALLLALTGVRAGGRWLYELIGLACAFLLRTRRDDLPVTGGTPATTLALLGMLMPGATVRTLETSQGPAMAVSHRGGLTAQLKPGALTPELLGTLPLPAALLPTGADNARYGVQFVLHAGVRPDAPRRLWVAVHAARTADTAVDAELALVLRNALRRVRRALDRAGVPAPPLAEEQALAAIAGLAHVTGGRTEVREDWRFWRTGPVNQAAFRVTGWDTLTEAQARVLLGGVLAGVPGVAATLTLGARTEHRGDAGRPSVALRLAATTETAVKHATDILAGRLAPSGVRLARLDGTHPSGVAATLPIGVFLP